MTIERKNIALNGWGRAAHPDEMVEREEFWSWIAEELGMPSLLATPAHPTDTLVPAPSRLSPAEQQSLARILGADRVRSGAFERASHARGKSYYDLIRLRGGDPGELPDAVVYPQNTKDVQQILTFADDAEIAVVPYGGGTSVAGGVSAQAGPFGRVVTLDLSGMNRVVEIDAVSGTIAAEAGIYGNALEKILAESSLTLGHYPESFEYSTLGGWIAHRATGQLSHRYGNAENWLISAKLATPKGLLATQDIAAARGAPRLTNFIIGSEGALGIITEARLRVRPLPEARIYEGYLFPDFASGLTAVRQAARDDIPAAMLRLCDATETRFYRALHGTGRAASLAGRLGEAFLAFRGFDSQAALLIAGFEGTRRTVSAGKEALRDIAGRLGAAALGTGPGERWLKDRFRFHYLRDCLLDRGLGVDTIEAAATWAKLPSLYVGLRNALQRGIREAAPYPSALGIVMCRVNQFYTDGASLQFTYVFPRSFDDDIAQWRLITEAATDAIDSHDGVGRRRATTTDSALGIEILRAVKHTLDPKGILNPGKLIPPE